MRRRMSPVGCKEILPESVPGILAEIQVDRSRVTINEVLMEGKDRLTINEVPIDGKERLTVNEVLIEGNDKLPINEVQ